MGPKQKWAYGQLTWPEVNAAVRADRVAIFPVGSVEGHGRHLPIDTDARLCEEVCRQVGQAISEEVVVLPSLAYGVSPHHIDFPGTLSITEPTYVRLLAEIMEDLVHHGFRRILVVNGHGGNHAGAEMATREVALRHPEVLCAAIAFFLLPGFKQRKMEVSPGKDAGFNGHADFVETSMYLAVDGDSVNMDYAEQGPTAEGIKGRLPTGVPLVVSQYWSAITPHGVLGDPRGASAEAGQRLLDAAVTGLVELIRALRNTQLGVRVDHREATA
jgi:creatinine amidohydrolase